MILVKDWKDLLSTLEDNSVDLIITDMPYNVTSCGWEHQVDLKLFWQLCNKVVKNDGCVILTARQPFTTDAINSNRKNFRYELIWLKQQGSDFLNSKRKPLYAHENILIFSKKQTKYNPQFTHKEPYQAHRIKVKQDSFLADKSVGDFTTVSDGRRYPLSYIKFNYDKNKKHPTQKPVELFKYLIETFTFENDLVVDPFCGVGTTALACIATNRKYICGDISEEYIAIAKERINGC